MKSKSLAMRDPAAAALLGAVGSDFGSDFGADYGDDFGDDMGDEFGADYGADYGADFGAAANPAAMARLAAKARSQAVARSRREVRLNPNQNSDLKVEDYTFTVNITDPATGAAPIFGTASSLSGTNTPDVWLRPTRVVMNVPVMGLVLVSAITIGNVNGTIGGQSDGIIYSPISVGVRNSFPLMSPSTKATFLGSWSALAPAPFAVGGSYNLSMSLVGPATMAPRG